MSAAYRLYRQRYAFSPVPSFAERRWRCFAPLLFLGSLALWPDFLPWPLVLLKFILALGSLLWLYQQRHLRPCRAFHLSDDGQGHWADDGSVFVVNAESRLLPSLLMLRLEQQGKRVWLWQHRDSYERADWHRLCRLVLNIQGR